MPALRLAEVAHRSDTGLVRTHNEDRALAMPPLIAVADGMGGAKAGEVAAQMTVDALATTGPAPNVGLVLEAIADANREIRELSASDPDHAGMGTTVTAVLMGDDAATVMHVGDSRAYVIRGSQIRQVTDDHSLVGELMRQGQLTEEEAEKHPSRNIITRALGAEPSVAVDQVPLALKPGDVVLVCSDGLSTMVTQDDMVRSVTATTSLSAAADALVQAALAGGGTDNVTVILGRVSDDGHPAVEHTTEIPTVAAEAPTTEVPQPPVPAAPTPTAKPQRTAAVLEATARGHRTRAQRALGLVTAIVALIVAVGAWAASRNFYVAARDGAATARVYHGAPFSLFGIDLSKEWADTGVDAAAIRAVDPTALTGDANGQGRAVTKATSLVWRFGLPTIATLELPPATPAKKTASATK